MLIIVATLAPEDGVPAARPELIARGFAGADELIEETRDEAARVLDELLAERRLGDQAPPGAPARLGRAVDLRQNAPAADDPSGDRRGMSTP